MWWGADPTWPVEVLWKRYIWFKLCEALACFLFSSVNINCLLHRKLTAMLCTVTVLFLDYGISTSALIGNYSSSAFAACSGSNVMMHHGQTQPSLHIVIEALNCHWLPSWDVMVPDIHVLQDIPVAGNDTLFWIVQCGQYPTSCYRARAFALHDVSPQPFLSSIDLILFLSKNTTVNDKSTAGRFDPKVFVNCVQDWHMAQDFNRPGRVETSCSRFVINSCVFAQKKN